jgi:membrane protein implicated in regulation of membrane protease activity
MVIAILCAIFLAIILFLGGLGDMDTDIDVDSDVDLDVDGDVDVDIDHDVDASGFGGGPSPFSLPVLLSIGTAFGAFGAIFEAYGMDPMTIPLLAIACAIGVGVLMFFAMWKMFKSTQATSTVSYDQLVGMKARVSVPIRESSEGQIIVTREETGRMLIGAISDEDCDVDDQVRIIERVGDVMKVEKIAKKKKKKEVK